MASKLYKWYLILGEKQQTWILIPAPPYTILAVQRLIAVTQDHSSIKPPWAQFLSPTLPFLTRLMAPLRTLTWYFPFFFFF